MPGCCDIEMISLPLPDGDDAVGVCILTSADLELKEHLPFPSRSHLKTKVDCSAKKKYTSAKKKVLGFFLTVHQCLLSVVVRLSFLHPTCTPIINGHSEFSVTTDVPNYFRYIPISALVI